MWRVGKNFSVVLLVRDYVGCRSPSTDLSYLQAQLRASRSILLLSLAHCQSLDALSAPVAQVLEIYINAAVT